MNELKKDIYKRTLLFDFYGDLLSDRNKEIYSKVICDDLSLKEASEIFGISRQGISDLIKRCDKSLENYENKLKLILKFNLIKNNLEKMKKILDKEVVTKKDRENIKNIIESVIEEL